MVPTDLPVDETTPGLKLDGDARRDLLLAIGALNEATIVEACAAQVGAAAAAFQWTAAVDIAFDLAVRARKLNEELHAAMLQKFGPGAAVFRTSQPTPTVGAPRIWTPGGDA